MKFHDYTIVGASILSHRLHDTTALVARNVEFARHLLGKLRQGNLREGFIAGDFPEYDVMLGLDNYFEDYSAQLGTYFKAPGRYFCVAPEDRPAFQFNVVIPAGARSEHQEMIDKRAVAALLCVSLSGDTADRDVESVRSLIEHLWQRRPFLATAVIPREPAVDCEFFRMVTGAANFSTLFAAAMLLDGEMSRTAKR